MLCYCYLSEKSEHVHFWLIHTRTFEGVQFTEIRTHHYCCWVSLIFCNYPWSSLDFSGMRDQHPSTCCRYFQLFKHLNNWCVLRAFWSVLHLANEAGRDIWKGLHFNFSLSLSQISVQLEAGKKSAPWEHVTPSPTPGNAVCNKCRECVSACEGLLQKPQILPTCGPISDSLVSVRRNHTENVWTSLSAQDIFKKNLVFLYIMLFVRFLVWLNICKSGTEFCVGVCNIANCNFCQKDLNFYCKCISIPNISYWFH